MNRMDLSMVKTIIVFGASSYIGRRLCEEFSSIGISTFAVYRQASQSLNKPKAEGCIHIFFDGTLASLSGMSGLSKDSTLVINCCGDSGLPNEVRNCDAILEANLSFTGKILKFMILEELDKLIITESYWQFHESGNQLGNTLYAVTKNMQSLLAEYFSRMYAVDIVGLVLYDVYGENDDRPKMLNYLAESLASSKEVHLTEGNQFVDFIHISDVIEAYKSAAQFLCAHGSREVSCYRQFYVNSDEPLSTLKSKVTNTLDSLGIKGNIVWSIKKAPIHQIDRPFVPENKESRIPNWDCKVSFHEGFRRLINYYEQ